ncbi:interleukin-4 [Choloepus didactylus]|uniref:interleukin-4 n=1 Tax=Choloepus didactylus TaxID=27675 RepID=UPI00189CB30F|nr:interleukin-4 [Choloepus didactylus]
MGLTFPLIPTLLCLLAGASDLVHGHKCGPTVQEIVKTLNILTVKKYACTELTVADVFAARKNTTENETFCRAASVLLGIYTRPKCFNKHLRGLYRSLSNMKNMTDCPVNETKTCTLKDFLERLKMIMKEKYSKCQR